MYLEFEKSLSEIEDKIVELKKLMEEKGVDLNSELIELERRSNLHKEQLYSNLSPWQTVQVARHQDRPVFQDFIQLVFTDFIELHGDRGYSDDKAMIGGFATIEGKKVMIIGHNKGKSAVENAERNFGMAKPEGYRKALRLMKLANQCHIPIITFIDTAGAFPGLDAEERGQAEAIARNLTEMIALETPIICLITGEGGSGGAIGIGVGDIILMLSNAVYSVISPEGCASILWRDAVNAPKAAEALKITAPSLYEAGIIDEVIAEPLGGAHRNYTQTAEHIRKSLLKHLNALSEIPKQKLLKKRFDKFAKMGKFLE